MNPTVWQELRPEVLSAAARTVGLPAAMYRLPLFLAASYELATVGGAASQAVVVIGHGIKSAPLGHRPPHPTASTF